LAAKKRSDEQQVRVAPLGELRAYTISEHELDVLEQGAPISDLLTIGLCLLSADVTVLATLLSTSLPELTFVLFFCALLILAIAGGVCTYMGWRLRTNTRELARRIRARPPSGRSCRRQRRARSPLPQRLRPGKASLPRPD
jgi:hypothetical protein